MACLLLFGKLNGWLYIVMLSASADRQAQERNALKHRCEWKSVCLRWRERRRSILQHLKCIEREPAGQSGNESGRDAPSLPAPPTPLLSPSWCRNRFALSLAVKRLCFPANGITSHTGGGIITTLISEILI